MEEREAEQFELDPVYENIAAPKYWDFGRLSDDGTVDKWFEDPNTVIVGENPFIRSFCETFNHPSGASAVLRMLAVFVRRQLHWVACNPLKRLLVVVTSRVGGLDCISRWVSEFRLSSYVA